MCPFIEDTVDLRKIAKIVNINKNSKSVLHWIPRFSVEVISLRYKLQDPSIDLRVEKIR